MAKKGKSTGMVGMRNLVTEVKRGRPTKYKKSYCDDIVEFMSSGATIVEWCVSVGHPKSTVDNWINEKAEFRSAVEVAKEVAEAWWQKNTREVFMFLPASMINTSLILNQVKSRFPSFREGEGEQPALVIPIVRVTEREPTEVNETRLVDD